MKRPEIIAEIGQNHNGDMALARELIVAAQENGADVVKFQVYDARSLFPRENNPWYDYNVSTELSMDDVDSLASFCNDRGVEFLASVFDETRVDWLEAVGVKRYKVASRSIHDGKLIERIILTGKPVIVSLGMLDVGSFPVINHAPVDFLYCVSKYPASLDQLKLSSIDFSRYSGFSDHTVGISAAVYALASGAKIIEKHFTLDKSLYGPDHSCSMGSEELKMLSTFRDEYMLLL
ncbi:MAG: N-acetylneuraminate synthase family protein [Proteobacteria bacterium]|nr:N-acetylneuraminate synthase family protein [Pseudomonadota bacterium]